jgi:Cof subfamily protein (haloacid dehalogenase superfamily)
MIKAIATDLDGTALAPGAVLTDHTRSVLRRCMAQGIRVIICTGRSLTSVRPYHRRIGIDGPVVCFNGGLVASLTPDGQVRAVLAAHYTDPAFISFCVDLARKRGLYFQAYFQHKAEAGQSLGEELLMAEIRNDWSDAYTRHTGIQVIKTDIKEALASAEISGCIKGMFICPAETLEEIRPLLEKALGPKAYLTRSSATFLEVTNAGNSKGTGLEAALQYLGLSREEALAFGDEENDIPLLRAAGMSAAPENAKDEVKAVAGRIIGPCSEEGVAAYLEETVLQKHPAP